MSDPTPSSDRRASPATFLFSVDLEDIRTMFDGGERYPERVPLNAERYLEFLARHEARCTFFVVGDVARRYPSLIAEIAAAGHELACHSDDHSPVVGMDRETFREDLCRCLDAISAAGVDGVTGYRAPSGSLDPQNAWAYETLRELGFRYSSSIIAARHPLYGWPGFGPDRPRMAHGLWEFPMTLAKLPGGSVPFASGVYLRALPFAVVRRTFRKTVAEGRPVVGYVHPYDIDADQDRFMHPQIGGNRFFNWLMYRNRGDVFRRLEELLALGAEIGTYADYLETELGGAAA